MHRSWKGAVGACVLFIAAAPPVSVLAAKAPTEWDGLVKITSKRLDLVYLLPNADFRPYTKVMIDPVEVAFRKNWMRDYNNQTASMSMRVDKEDTERIAGLAREGFDKVMTDAYAAAGYQIVTTPGPDVLRLRPAVINLAVAAPDVAFAGRSRTWTMDAGEATVVLEVRDSETNAVIGRALDRRTAGDASRAMMRSGTSNRADFMQLFKLWAKASVDGLARLKAASPIDASGAVAAR